MVHHHDMECSFEMRRYSGIHGIDYVEVSSASTNAQRFLNVYLFGNWQEGSLEEFLKKTSIKQFKIVGGYRIKNIRVLSARAKEGHLVLEVDKPGDFSTYNLIIDSNELDPAYSSCEFGFRQDCHRDMDCSMKKICPQEARIEPLIDYMAKDYASFRQALLDMIPSLVPDWKERHEADLAMVMLELLAYRADHLSYYQDSVANEAFLRTARQRTSVRRHASLLDYRMHEGSSARAIISFPVVSTGWLPSGTRVLTKITSPLSKMREPPGFEILPDQAEEAMNSADAVFEIISDAYLHEELSEMEIHTWGDEICCLQKGCTSADIKGKLTANFAAADIKDPDGLSGIFRSADDPVSRYIKSRLSSESLKLLKEQEDSNAGPDLIQSLVSDLNRLLLDRDLYDKERFKNIPLSSYVLRLAERRLQTNRDLMLFNRFLFEAAYPNEISISPKLTPGSLLLFEEVAGPESGLPEDADLKSRQIVRITDLQDLYDPLIGVPVTRIIWDKADSLRFPLCVSALKEDGSTIVAGVAMGNLALADHGRRIENELHPSPDRPSSDLQWRAHSITLDRGPLSFSMIPDDPSQPASSLLKSDSRNSRPQILSLTVPNVEGNWIPAVPDLLACSSFERAFSVEPDNSGRAVIRFGDGEFGMAPPEIYSDSEFDERPKISVTYKVGLGRRGNVGSDSLVHVIRPENASGCWPQFKNEVKHPFQSMVAYPIRNPIPAWGGSDPESLETVKLHAPAALRSGLMRAVTEEDYAAIAKSHPQVQKAVATFRWTGSWHTVFVTIDPEGTEEDVTGLKESVKSFLSQYALAGYDLEIDLPRYVPLEISIDICVSNDHFQSHVKSALIDELSCRVLSGGRLGFFHPDNFTFGQPVYLSQLYSAIGSVQGVESATVTVFKRKNNAQETELEEGRITMGRLEIARLNNDLNSPDHGILELRMSGGK